MGLPRKLLGNGEVEVLHLRSHGKALIGPAAALLLIAVATGMVAAWTPATWQPAAGWIFGIILALLTLVAVVKPFLDWLTTTYTVTDRRIITRRGILTKTGHDLPLTRVNNVAYERHLIDRLLGCGTLVLTTAAEQPVTLRDIPDVERVHVVMTELLFGSEERQDPPQAPLDAGE